MRIRPWIKWIIAAGLSPVVPAVALFLLFRPSVMERTEIYKGVFLTVDKIPRSGHGGGRVMILEVHWKTPGVRLAGREFSYPVNADNPVDPHYTLINADYALSVEGASALVNTTGYQPEQFYRSFPGLPVRSGETVVVDGQVSHIHEHTYLMYWDHDWNVQMLPRKPPDQKSLDEAILAIGVQGIPISDGQIRPQAMDHTDLVMARTFIGVDPVQSILYLIAFEKASGVLMLEKAKAVGVIHGSMVDSGNATHLLIGSGAKGVWPHSGIRHWRPLGAYLTVFAEPL